MARKNKIPNQLMYYVKFYIIAYQCKCGESNQPYRVRIIFFLLASLRYSATDYVTIKDSREKSEKELSRQLVNKELAAFTLVI